LGQRSLPRAISNTPRVPASSPTVTRCICL
jgi:hypothetical protein